MKTTAAVESATAANGATVEPTSRRATRKSASAYNSTSTSKPTSAYKSTSTHKSTSADEPTSAPAAATPATAPTAVPAPPRTSADKQSTRKPVRPVVAIRRAGIRVISVVAVRACRLCIHSHANRNLRLRITQRQHQNRNQSQIFHVPHGVPPCPRSASQLIPTESAGLLDLVSIRSAYVFELGLREKVAGVPVADFSHSA
jgi:hypothetical protein